MRPFGVEEESTTEVQLGDGEPPTPPDQAAPAASKTGFTEPPRRSESANLNSPAKPSTTTSPRSLNPPSATSPTGNAHCVSQSGGSISIQMGAPRLRLDVR